MAYVSDDFKEKKIVENFFCRIFFTLAKISCCFKSSQTYAKKCWPLLRGEGEGRGRGGLHIVNWL